MRFQELVNRRAGTSETYRPFFGQPLITAGSDNVGANGSLLPAFPVVLCQVLIVLVISLCAGIAAVVLSAGLCGGLLVADAFLLLALFLALVLKRLFSSSVIT